MLIALESTGLHFYPRPPRGGRRARPAPTRTSMVFLSTPSARRATRRMADDGSPVIISIHALREEGDRRRAFAAERPQNFYPRPPRGGRRKALGIGANVY